MKHAAEKYFRKIIVIAISWLTVLFTVPVRASSVIDVGLTVSQFSAELVAPSSFIATEPDGKKATLNKGNIKLGDRQLASGTVLEIEELEDKNGASAGRPRQHFTVNRQEYRGTLKICLTNEGKKLTVINRVPIEYYVNSVLGPKSSPIWPDEAIKAQAVAARSLAWYYKHHPDAMRIRI